jgi:hypothetical protein
MQPMRGKIMAYISEYLATREKELKNLILIDLGGKPFF